MVFIVFPVQLCVCVCMELSKPTHILSHHPHLSSRLSSLPILTLTTNWWTPSYHSLTLAIPSSLSPALKSLNTGERKTKIPQKILIPGTSDSPALEKMAFGLVCQYFCCSKWPQVLGCFWSQTNTNWHWTDPHYYIWVRVISPLKSLASPHTGLQSNCKEVKATRNLFNRKLKRINTKNKQFYGATRFVSTP